MASESKPIRSGLHRGAGAMEEAFMALSALGCLIRGEDLAASRVRMSGPR
jgi:hypothetical protein